MLAVVFLLLIIALLFGFEAYYKGFVVVSFYDVKGISFMERNIFLHEKKYFFS